MPLTLRLAVVPRVVLILLLLAALLAIAVTGMVVGGQLHLLRAAVVLPATGPAGNGLIAYDAADDIWVVNPDGTDPRQLTSGPGYEFGPVWSRDGTRLAYWSAEDAARTTGSLVVVEADGSKPVRIAPDLGEYIDWSPDGKHIAYARCIDQTEDCTERAFVAATDGSGSAQIGEAGLTARVPVWSPDGTRIAFAGNRAGLDAGVYVMAPDGTGVLRLSEVTDDDQYAFFTLDWSPDGGSIATNASGSQVWVVPADGSSDRAITDGPEALGPTWSADGERIAYFTLASSQLHVIPAEGGAITNLGSSAKAYAWSPDGTRMAVLGRSITTGGSGPGLAIIDAATGDVLAEVEAPASMSTEGLTPYPSWQRVALP